MLLWHVHPRETFGQAPAGLRRRTVTRDTELSPVPDESRPRSWRKPPHRARVPTRHARCLRHPKPAPPAGNFYWTTRQSMNGRSVSLAMPDPHQHRPYLLQRQLPRVIAGPSPRFIVFRRHESRLPLSASAPNRVPVVPEPVIWSTRLPARVEVLVECHPSLSAVKPTPARGETRISTTLPSGVNSRCPCAQ